MIFHFGFSKRMRPFRFLALLLFVVAGLPSSSDAQEPAQPSGVTVRAAIPESWPPQYFLDTVGNPTGFAIDVMNAIAKRVDIHIEYIVKPTIGLAMEAVASGEADLMPNTGITSARKLDLNFTAPVETFPISIFVREGTPNISGQLDLAGRKVAVTQGNVAVNLLSSNKAINLQTYTDARSALFDLIAGRIDAFVYPEPVLLALAREAGVGSRIKVVGKPLAEIKRAIGVHKGQPDLFNTINRAVTAFVGTPEYQQIYVKWYGKDEPYWTVFRLSLLFSALTLLAVGLTVTWRFWSLRQINQDLNQSLLEAKIASRAKAEFIANMSHELRTPLNAIIGFSETIKEEVFGPIGNVKYLDYLCDIHVSGQHLLGIINDILDVSAIEAGALELHEAYLSLSCVVDSSVRIIMPRANGGQVSVTYSIDPALPLIYADDRRVKQILLNLLSNAVKFTPEGGKVDVTAWLNDDRSLAIAVKDTGIGMNEADIEKAKSAFGQVDSGLNRKHEGTGLGLPLSKGLMELHGGALDIKSKIGRGTQITLTFPKERVIQDARQGT